MTDKKMQTKPYGIEDKKVKIEKIMTIKERADRDKKYGIGLYEKSTLQSKKIKNPKFYGYTNIKKY